MSKLLDDIRTAWYFFWWHRRQPPPDLSRGKVRGKPICSTDIRMLHPAYTPTDLTMETCRVAAEQLLLAILLRPYKVDIITEPQPGHNHTMVHMMATPVRDTNQCPMP